MGCPTVPGMAHTVQVTVDSSTPHELADWWAETLGWEREPSDDAFIRRMVEAGHAAEADTMLHRGVLVWRAGAAIRAPGGVEPRVLFQLVTDAKTVKNRVHLDVRTEPGEAEAELARLLARGATELHRGQQGPSRWVTLADPEGNEFCLS